DVLNGEVKESGRFFTGNGNLKELLIMNLPVLGSE
ncbi:MAG: hypothetical protein QG610_2332, partial [Euryarchaeota archaeon]|nr:hypothetical protein [Euryarchaeota archaeon]